MFINDYSQQHDFRMSSFPRERKRDLLTQCYCYSLVPKKSSTMLGVTLTTVILIGRGTLFFLTSNAQSALHPQTTNSLPMVLDIYRSFMAPLMTSEVV